MLPDHPAKNEKKTSLSYQKVQRKEELRPLKRLNLSLYNYMTFGEPKQINPSSAASDKISERVDRPDSLKKTRGVARQEKAFLLLLTNLPPRI
jgi:hypothetical protein